MPRILYIFAAAYVVRIHGPSLGDRPARERERAWLPLVACLAASVSLGCASFPLLLFLCLPPPPCLVLFRPHLSSAPGESLAPEAASTLVENTRRSSRSVNLVSRAEGGRAPCDTSVWPPLRRDVWVLYCQACGMTPVQDVSDPRVRSRRRPQKREGRGGREAFLERPVRRACGFPSIDRTLECPHVLDIKSKPRSVARCRLRPFCLFGAKRPPLLKSDEKRRHLHSATRRS